MHKVVLALGDRSAEAYLEELQDNYKVVGITTHKGGVYQQLEHHRPHLLVIRDNLPGKDDFLQLIFRIRGEFPDVVIIVLAHGRQAGDPVLAALVNYGVHNILYGDGINLNRVIELFTRPMNYSDVQHLQPMAVLDEEADRVSWAPGIIDAGLQPIPETGPQPGPETGGHSVYGAGTPLKPDAAAHFLSDTGPQPVPKTTKPAVVACWGVTGGVGSSTLALNLAVVLADNGYRTILLELDPEMPAIGIWLSLYRLDKGTETVLSDPASFDEAVINSHTRADDDTGHAARVFNKLPPSLELLAFSQAYLVNESTRSPGSSDNLHNLLTVLVFHHHYDVVVMDLAPGTDHPLTLAGIRTSNRILCSVTGDIAVMAHSRLALERLAKWVPGAEKRLSVVDNRSIGEFTPDFEELLGRRADFSIPETALLTPALARSGLPAVLDNRCRSFREAIEHIAGEINPVTLTGQTPPKSFLKKLWGGRPL